MNASRRRIVKRQETVDDWNEPVIDFTLDCGHGVIHAAAKAPSRRTRFLPCNTCQALDGGSQFKQFWR